MSVPAPDTVSTPTRYGLPGWLKLLLKVAVSGGCLWYVGRKIDWPQALALLRQSRWAWVALAMLLFVASKLLSSFRLNLYFRQVQLRLPELVNLRLYWLGMFYNLFLPGGIGGDAYKVILLNRRYPSIGSKKLTAAVLLDRISGVAGLGILAGCFWGWLFRAHWYGLAVVAAIVPAVALFQWVVQRWFPSFTSSFWPTLWMGLAVQALQVACVWAIMQSIGIHESFAAFQLLFLLSSIVAIFPFTMGGLGARELVFLWGSAQFGLQQHQAIYISLLFYLLTALASLVGLVWMYRPPLAGKGQQ
jgi:uncharacterized membrane protein YbhN (UPF0104 family)